MRKLFIVAVLALGCTSFTGPDGIYTLTTVNGYRVPFTIGHAINPPEELLIEIADGTLTVTDGRYEQRVAIRTTRRVCIVPDCTLQVERNVIEATGLVQTSHYCQYGGLPSVYIRFL